jgi:putative ATP-dependent endonuclease of the OLD family
MEIGACFTFEEEEIAVIDSSNPTSLKDEYLLNMMLGKYPTIL